MRLLKTYRPDSYVWIAWDYPLVLEAGRLRKAYSKVLYNTVLLARIAKRSCKWRK